MSFNLLVMESPRAPAPRSPIPVNPPEAAGVPPAIASEGGAAEAADRVAYATPRLVAGFVAMVACLVVLGILAATIRRQPLNGVDAAISPWLHGLSSPTLDAAMNAASFVGSDPVLAVLLVVGVVILAARRRPMPELLFLVVALAGSIALNWTMKNAFARARPQFAWAHVPTDYSFPSGHSMNAFAFYVAAAVLVWVIAGPRRGAWAVAAALALVATIGVSRIYLGVHYFTDVIGGFTAAALWLLIVGGIVEVGRRRGRARP